MTKGAFFCICLSHHRMLGAVFSSHIVKQLNENGGVFSIADNVTAENESKWASLISAPQSQMVKLIGELSDASLLKNLGKKHKTAAEFYREVESNEVFGSYTRQYVERRMAKCFDLIATTETPVFIKEKTFNNLYDHNQLEVERQNAAIVFHFKRTPTETLYRLSSRIGNRSVSLLNSDSEIVCNNPCIIRTGRHLLRFEHIDAKKLSPFFTKSHISIPKATERKYFETFVLNAIKNYTVEAEGFRIEWIQHKPLAQLALEPTLSGKLGLVLEFAYGSKRYLSHTSPQREVYFEPTGDDFIFRCFERNVGWEKDTSEKLNQLGIEVLSGAERKPTSISINSESYEYQLVEWLNANSASLQQAEIELIVRNSPVPYYTGQCSINIASKFENDWFDVYGTIQLDGFEIPLINLKRNLLRGIREFLLPNGQVFILPAHWFEKYRMLVSVSHEEGLTLRMRPAQFETLLALNIPNETAKELCQKFENPKEQRAAIVPQSLRAQLRSYQKNGLYWLQLLESSCMGGCLADDMGLGKTLQAIALIVHLKETGLQGNIKAPTLVVVPTSLVFNWEQELARFAPTLKVKTFIGTNRTRNFENWITFDVVITTYGIVRNDIDFLMQCNFNYVILDECQNIKNPASKIYRSAMLLKARRYLALSGTPIENSLLDLWAIMNFVNRGILGSIRFFKEEFAEPIESNGDESALKRLKRLVKPFILRRTKNEVAPDLPLLSHQTLVCNLTDEQLIIYEQEKVEAQKEILRSIEEVGYKKSAIHILRSLTRLRQIANHPKLIDPHTESDSGKFNQICESIGTIASEGHKILVFSSFVKHLDLVEEFLNSEQIAYSKLIGSTTNRSEAVERFNSSSCRVFLISLKAGGTGLNLTSADYVFILDPWWNPAAEDQAISRTHRIGRDKPVFVYRFISAQTVEEKIQKLQERKQSLAADIVGSLNPLDLIEQDELLQIIN